MRRVILDAAIELLLERGARDVTAAGVAERADVARTTVYRHWPDQASLLLATIDALTVPHHAAPVVGRLADDVRAALRDLRMRLVSRDVRSVFGALAEHAVRDQAFAAAQRRFVQQLIHPTTSALEAALERGELGEDVDCWFEATLLAAPVLHQYLVVQDEVADRLIDETVERWLSVKGIR